MNLKNNKGVTLAALTLTIIVMLIITSIIIYRTNIHVRTEKINKLYNDIESISTKIEDYYLKYGEFPILGKYGNNKEEIIALIRNNAESNLAKFQEADITIVNPNDSNDYYVIDLEKLDGLTLNYGYTDDYQNAKGYKDSSYIPIDALDEIYIINKETHQIYYPNGIFVDGYIYYCNSSYFNEAIEQETITSTTGGIKLNNNEEVLLVSSCKIYGNQLDNSDENNNDNNDENQDENIKILPDSYKQVEYIQATGTQYINTLTVPNENQRYEIKFVPTLLNTNQMVFGSRSSGTYSTSKDQVYLNLGKNNNISFFSGTTMNRLVESVEINKLYELNLDKDDFENNYDNNSSKSLYLFALNNIGTAAAPISMDLYSFKIYENDVLIKDFIPCYSTATVTNSKGNTCEAGTVGLYDLVEGKFYTNEGTGTFGKGADVTTDTEVDDEQGSSESVLSADYQQVEYIQATGTQYINTNILSTNAKIEIDFKFNQINNKSQVLVNCYKNTGGWFGLLSTGYITLDGNNFNAEYNIRSSYTIEYKNGIVSCTDEKGNIKTKSVTPNTQFTLFGAGNVTSSNYGSLANVYGVKIYEYDILVRDFIPCYSTTTVTDSKGKTCEEGTAGLYDLVEGKFYTNDGTGIFTMGPIVQNQEENTKLSINTTQLDGILLSEDYKSLGYIQATGTQYIDTGYVNSSDYNPYKIEAEYQITESPSSTMVIFGTALNTGNINPLIFGISSSKNWFGHYGSSGGSVMWGTADINKHKVKYVFGEGIYLDDIYQTDTQTQGKQSSNSTKNIGLFARIRGTEPASYAKAKLYSCKFYEQNDVLVRDFVPCYRISDNAIGLYDCIENKFYGNNGTGTFNKGFQEQTSEIILNKPLNENEYIDLVNKKVYRIDSSGNSYFEDIDIPTISFFTGENEITVNSEVIPSKMEITYLKIKK